VRIKQINGKRLLAVLLAVVLLPVSFAFAEEKEEIIKEKGVPDVNPAVLFSWYYATAGLPAGSTLAENSLRFGSLYPEKPVIGGDGKEEEPKGEKVTTATVTWKDGSYFLSKSIQVMVDDEGAEIRLDPERMQWTGNAVVTLVLESEHYRYETDRELTVLDPEKTPSFTQKV